MSEYIIVAAVSIAIGFLLSKVIRFININAYHKDVVAVLVRNMETENEYAQALGAKSMIDYTIEKKGLDYALFHYGRVYKLFTAVRKKDAATQKIENSLAIFLNEAMKEEIREYRDKRAKAK